MPEHPFLERSWEWIKFYPLGVSATNPVSVTAHPYRTGRVPFRSTYPAFHLFLTVNMSPFSLHLRHMLHSAVRSQHHVVDVLFTLRVIYTRSLVV